MKAVRKVEAGFGAKVVDVDIPKLSSHQVLVKVRAASICGTDGHIYRWNEWAAGRIKPPLTFGHEFSGEVVEVGNQVERIKVGDNASAETHIPCMGCKQCRTGRMHICQNVSILGVDRDGCFAEYVALPEICCLVNNKVLSWEVASLQEPLGNAVYSVRTADVSAKSVVIFGDGPIGIFATAISRLFGATKIIVVGMQQYRLEIIKKYNPDLVINARDENPIEIIEQATKGEGVDVVLEMSGAEDAFHQGLKVLSRGGKFIAFGIPSKPIHLNVADELIFKGVDMIAINGRKMFETWYEVANLLNSDRLDIKPVITHTFKLDEIDEAMKLLTGKEIKAGKIILKTS
ncbi:MAG: L-threonine 3-dehydrogenase [Pseudomonadota bacterium]